MSSKRNRKDTACRGTKRILGFGESQLDISRAFDERHAREYKVLVRIADPMPTVLYWLAPFLFGSVDAFLRERPLTWSSNGPAARLRRHSPSWIGGLEQRIGTVIRLLPPPSSSSSAAPVVVIIDPETILNHKVTARISNLIHQRAAARWRGDYALADEYRHQIDTLLLPDHFRIVVTDNPRDNGGGSSWSLTYHVPIADADMDRRPSVLNLAHKVLGLSVSHADRSRTVPADTLALVVMQAKDQLSKWSIIDRELRLSSKIRMQAASLSRLMDQSDESNKHALLCWSAVERDLSGRKAADAAFWFAIAGVTDSELFHLLTSVCVKELQRFGDRPSCRPKDVLAIVERLAAAGITNGVHDELEGTVRHCLATKSVPTADAVLSLHADHCAAMIWNFSTRQRKQRAFLSEASRHWEEHENPDISQLPLSDNSCSGLSDNACSGLAILDWKRFLDPNRDLVIDLRCGMGVSLLGLASLHPSDSVGHDFNWSNCNFVGVDLSPMTVNYANGIAQRWAIDGRLVFVVDAVEHFLDTVKSYPGRIARILIQFPTPYRQQSASDKGNSQLPKTAHDGFMVSHKVLELAAELLRDSQGELILQSNCEDVAVWMRQSAIEHAGFRSRDSGEFATKIQGTPTLRTLNWIANGGERAIGPGWSDKPLLPRVGRTETEIACMMNGTPVHRCVLVADLTSKTQTNAPVALL
jgi:tRNA G46 methylase TrmB